MSSAGTIVSAATSPPNSIIFNQQPRNTPSTTPVINNNCNSYSMGPIITKRCITPKSPQQNWARTNVMANFTQKSTIIADNGVTYSPAFR